MATRAVICRTLGELGDPVARDAMIRLVRDPDGMIRAEASGPRQGRAVPRTRPS